MECILRLRCRSVPKRLEWLDRRAVRVGVAPLLKAVEDSQEGPHSLMEMRVEMAVENGVPNHAGKAARTVQKIQGIALLGGRWRWS